MTPTEMCPSAGGSTVTPMRGPHDDRDPGWPPLWHALLPRLITRRFGSTGTLWSLRRVFLVFTLGLVYIGAVVLIVDTAGEDRIVSPAVMAVIVVAVGCAGAVASSWMVRRFLRRVDTHPVLVAYPQLVLGRIAFAEFAALVGFVGFVLSNAQWVAMVGLLLTLAMFAPAAPTASAIRRLDERLRLHRPGISLTEALYGEAE